LKIFFSILCCLVLSIPVFGQMKKRKPKNSFAKGALDIYWGYNRSFYTASTLSLSGDGYDFTLDKVQASDRPEKSLGTYVNPKTFTVPQFNLRAGYTFWNNYHLSLGYDHMKYVIRNNQTSALNGYIAPGLDSQWSGNYTDESVVLNENQFHYENSDGMNYIRLQFSRIDQWFRTRNSGWFAVNTVMGLSAGMILSQNDLNFGGEFTRKTVSLSGYGISGHIGLRLEFWRHLYLQTNLAGGFIHQTGVKTRPEGPDLAKQKMGYLASETVLGFIFYIRPTNDCNTCPHW
jgi:hypothetical protein